MPIVVWHQNAADTLNPAANAGRFRGTLMANEDARQQQQLNFQQEQAEAAQQLYAERMAQNQALQAAELVEQQRTAAEKNALARDLGQQRAATAVDVAQTRAQGAVETQQVRNEGANQRVKLTAQQRRELNTQSHTLEMEEQKAAREGRYQDATNLQKQRQQASAAAAEANRQFNERLQQQRQQHQQMLQNRQLGAISAKTAASVAYGREKQLHETKLNTIDQRIGQLQKQYAVEVDAKKREQMEDQIEQAMQAYETAASAYTTWLGRPAGATTQPATTQPAAGGAGPIIVNKQTGQRMQLDPATNQWVPIQ